MEISTAGKTGEVPPVRMIPGQRSPIVTNPVEQRWVRLLLAADFLYVTLRILGNPLKAVRVIRQMRRKYRTIFGEKMLTKVARVDGKYYWRLAGPGFPSAAARRSRENEVNRFAPFQPSNGMRSIIFGITKKCPLSCEHCYEWDRLRDKETLSREDLIAIMHKYQDYGATQMILSGGEPLLRIKDIYAMLQQAKPGTDFWIVTSGRQFKAEQAVQLKRYGLTGILVSLDHHLPEAHDKFRGTEGIYEMAVHTAIEAKKAGLVTALSLCATREYTNKENLRAYMELAKRLGVSFVQILEPKAVGRYQGKAVDLSPEQTELLDRLYLEYNQSKKYREYPIVNYLGYHQRRMGCFGSGDYFFYIDTDGDAHACPMCAGKVCNTLEFSASDTVRLLQQNTGCRSFTQHQDA